MHAQVQKGSTLTAGDINGILFLLKLLNRGFLSVFLACGSCYSQLTTKFQYAGARFLFFFKCSPVFPH